MFLYLNLILVGIAGLSLSAYLTYYVPDPKIAFLSSALSYILSLMVTFMLTKKEVKKECDEVAECLKEEYQTKIRKIKREHDTTTLEKTIRDGTQTLIKNALDYFKIENIKNEMGNSAAMQNLQLDKYGQIIELLADFSLILPDRKENQEIVQQEIIHQIEIYTMDERRFSEFLQRIMEKYLVTVNKKIREKGGLHTVRATKICPRCAEHIMLKARVCKHCGHEFEFVSNTGELDWLRKGQSLYRSGNFQEAVSLFTNAIDINPRSARAYYNRGITYEKLGNQARTVSDLTTAAQLGHKKAQEALKMLSSMMDTQEWKWE
jgi:tetratricopeptide (TPR) repeat protein